MATKVTILGQEPKEEKKLKQIELIRWLAKDGEFEIASGKCTEWENVLLLEKKYTEDLDLMYLYDNGRKMGCLYLGHFNDGIV
jgi:hypothetical protein